jgi:hypothetical protein
MASFRLTMVVSPAMDGIRALQPFRRLNTFRVEQ